MARRPVWVFAGLHPWVWEEIDSLHPVGNGTEYPVETGFVGTAFLYWQPRCLTLAGDLAWSGSGSGSFSDIIGPERGTLARHCILARVAEISHGEEFDNGDRWSVSYVRYPASRWRGSPNENWMKQTFTGAFEVGSSADNVSLEEGGRHVGYLTISANPGGGTVRQWQIPIYAHGPDVLVTSLNLVIGWENWLAP